MSTQIKLKNFEEIYQQTYQETLKYMISHCNNLEDVNDLIQETYVEFYKKLKRLEKIEVEKSQAFLIGIAKNIIKKYYRFHYQKRSNIIELEGLEATDEKIDLEVQFITKENVAQIWKILENKDVKIAKIFYLYYGLDMKIKEIAVQLNLTESAVKNYLYRTIKELKRTFWKEGEEYEQK